MHVLRNYINGKFQDAPTSTKTVDVLNPAINKVICTIPNSDAQAVDDAVKSAMLAQSDWAKRPPIERAGYLRQISAKIRENAEEFARIVSEEQGKLLDLARVEAAFAADYVDYMAEWARRIEGEIIPSDRPGEKIFLFRQPIGVVAGILPWNFPLFLIVRKMAPALITGNSIVIKPSEETPHNAELFAKLVGETDLPAGLFNVVHGVGQATGQALASHPDVGLVTFTGSVQTGSAIMLAAAKNITKVNLELGGKAPAIVAEDADIDLAVSSIKAGRILNSGQVCNAPERVYVDRKVSDEFVSKLADSMRGVVFGNPLGDTAVDMGPLINDAAVGKVSELVASATRSGAEVVCGGRRGDAGSGNYFEATVVANCPQDSDIMQREIFGPVMPVNVVDGLDEAIARANDSIYGLTSSIYTRNVSGVMRAVDGLKFGETYVNRENFEAMQGFHAGVKRSGIGGADGKHGLYEFMDTHMVYLQA